MDAGGGPWIIGARWPRLGGRRAAEGTDGRCVGDMVNGYTLYQNVALNPFRNAHLFNRESTMMARFKAPEPAPSTTR